MDFQLVSDYRPRGDQGNAIQELVSGLAAVSSTDPCSELPARAKLYHGQDHRAVESPGIDPGSQ